MESTLHEIIDYAKEAERVAQKIYADAAERARHPGSRKLLTEMAEQEAGHEKALDELDVSNIGVMTITTSEDLRIADFLEDIELKPDGDFQTILIFAMKQEQIARDFYKAMTYRCKNDDEKKLFEILAAQEQQHKATLERIYDDEVLREN